MVLLLMVMLMRIAMIVTMMMIMLSKKFKHTMAVQKSGEININKVEWLANILMMPNLLLAILKVANLKSLSYKLSCNL